jgi:hypothetical protein
MMVLADGHASEPELQILERIAADIGIEPAELAEWRARWTEHAAELAEHIVAFAAVLIHHDGTIDPAEASSSAGSSRACRSPRAQGRGDRRLPRRPPTLGHLGARLAALPRDRRLTVLRALAPLVAASSNADLGRRFFLDLARAAAIPEAQASVLLLPRGGPAPSCARAPAADTPAHARALRRPAAADRPGPGPLRRPGRDRQRRHGLVVAVAPTLATAAELRQLYDAALLLNVAVWFGFAPAYLYGWVQYWDPGARARTGTSASSRSPASPGWSTSASTASSPPDLRAAALPGSALRTCRPTSQRKR